MTLRDNMTATKNVYFPHAHSVEKIKRIGTKANDRRTKCLIKLRTTRLLIGTFTDIKYLHCDSVLCSENIKGATCRELHIQTNK